MTPVLNSQSYHKAAGRKTRLDIQNYGCNGNLLCDHGVVTGIITDCRLSAAGFYVAGICDACVSLVAAHPPIDCDAAQLSWSRLETRGHARPRRHLDRFSRFSTARSHVQQRHTVTHTDHGASDMLFTLRLTAAEMTHCPAMQQQQQQVM